MNSPNLAPNHRTLGAMNFPNLVPGIDLKLGWPLLQVPLGSAQSFGNLRLGAAHFTAQPPEALRDGFRFFFGAFSRHSLTYWPQVFYRSAF
jgi:hypothetical protein